MSRASLVGNRLVKLKGGQPSPVFFVVADSSASDLSRGIRVQESQYVTEIWPRPVLIRVTSEQITKQSAILQLGDYQTQISTDQVTESDLKNKSAYIKVGGTQEDTASGDRFRIVHYNIRYTAGAVVCFDMFLRGVIS